MECNDFTGVPVRLQDTGKTMGVVADLVVSLGDGALLGFLVRSGTLIKKTRFLKASDALHLSVYAIDIPSAAVLKPYRDTQAMRWQSDLRGKKVYDICGKRIGSIYNLEFSDELTHIAGVVVTDGIAQDVAGGRRTIRPDELKAGTNGFIERSKWTCRAKDSPPD